jgi:hypothetical protein
MFRGPRTYFAYSVLAITLGSCQAKTDGLKGGIDATASPRGGNGGARNGGARAGGAGGSANLGGATVPDAAPDLKPALPDAVAMEAAPPPVDMRPRELWKPTVGLTWDYQLVSPINPAAAVQVYEIGLFDTLPAVVTDLHTRGKKVICHVDMGTFEDWHPDAERIPKEAIGPMVVDHRWLDIRNHTLVAVMRGRLDMAVKLGCDGIMFDNVDAWDTKIHGDVGFPLLGMDQLIYNRTLASEARAKGLAVGLMNDVHQLDELVPAFDFSVTEECFEGMECDLQKPFLDAGKPVFDVEYTLTTTIFCAMAKTMKISAIKKKPELDAFREACP